MANARKLVSAPVLPRLLQFFSSLRFKADCVQDTDCVDCLVVNFYVFFLISGLLT
jgi:hypothetical protein